METRGEVRVLRRGPHRSVVEETSGAVAVVVKRFHHPRRLRALRDPARARREHRVLAVLHRAGARVPEPLGIERTPAGWAVRMERVAGAASLESLFLEGRTPPGGWGRVVARLGRCLARVHAARVVHPDLHAGNVMVDARGLPWLIDFHHARLARRALRAERMLHDVVVATAEAREHLPAPTRARFALAWRAALPRELRARIDPGFELDEIERRGRLHRRATLAKGAGRWLRESSRCRRVRRPGDGRGRLLVRRDLPEGMPTERILRFANVSPAEARARWLCAARLLEHALPVLRPAVLEIGRRRATVVFETPPRGEGTGRVGERELGALLGRLHDRGLDLDELGPDSLWTGAGGPFLIPPTALRRCDPLAAHRDRPGRFGALGGAPVGPELVVAYLDVFADRPRERARIRAQIDATRDAHGAKPFSRA